MTEFPEDWENPKWAPKFKCHEWKNYISVEIASMWDTFNAEQKKAIARNAEEMADGENWN